MVIVDNLSKGFGGQHLFEKASFNVNSRERIGLVGRNGHGKTTLFRIITGEEAPEEGSILLPKHYRIGYVRQNLEFTADTILKEGIQGLREPERDHYWKVEKVLAGLGFSAEDMQRPPQAFSGGFQVRLNLAKVLVSEPDLLLLDEPTNYLDITSIRWVERFLLSWPRELMLITHDRSFMDRVVTHVLGIHRRRTRKISGTTAKYYAQIAQDEEVYEKTRQNDGRRQKEIELFITRFRAKARLANMVQSRIKTLDKMEKRDRLENIKALDFSFRSSPFSAKQVLAAKEVSFGYNDGLPLIQDLNLTIGARERVCVVGPNGKGKTTLLKLLAGTLAPRSGELTYHPAVSLGCYEQTHVSRLVDSRTVEEEILYSTADLDRQKARNICGAMMFEGDAALKKIGVLSGGEKSRVMLGQLLTRPLNLLLLDEPTNHLDMDSCDALLAALACFEGTVVMVTHNEMFLHALAERLIVFQDGRITLFDGTYQRFLAKGGWNDDPSTLKAAGPKIGGQAPAAKRDKKEIRRRRSEIITERSRALKPLEREVRKTENAIEARERELEVLNTEMQAASEAGDGSRIAAIGQRIHQCQSAIEQFFDALEATSDALDAENSRFDQKLAQLGPTENGL